MSDELGVYAGSATSGAEDVNANAIVLAVARISIRSFVEGARKQLFDACLSDGMPADQAREVSTKVIRMALELEAKRFATS